MSCTITFWEILGVWSAQLHGSQSRHHYMGSVHPQPAAPHEFAQGRPRSNGSRIRGARQQSWRHKPAVQVKVQALDFSCDEQYLASLGGQDDNALVSLAELLQWCICLGCNLVYNVQSLFAGPVGCCKWQCNLWHSNLQGLHCSSQVPEQSWLTTCHLWALQPERLGLR